MRKLNPSLSNKVAEWKITRPAYAIERASINCPHNGTRQKRRLLVPRRFLRWEVLKPVQKPLI